MKVADVDTTGQPSMLRAWWALVWFSLGRQARARQMVLIAVGLLIVTGATVAIITAGGWWQPRKGGQFVGYWLDEMTARTKLVTSADAPAAGVTDAITGAWRAMLLGGPFMMFSKWFAYGVFLNFLLPIWCLSFASEALGSDREGRTMVWLLSRPLPRPAIYLAKFVALLPWTITLGLGGFAVLCLLGGKAGQMALSIYWPAILAATLAFSSLFHLMSACVRHPAVIAIVYSFFLETVVGNLPGTMKRISIGFYTRCIMFERAEKLGMPPPENASIYLPVDPTTAWLVLLGLTVVCLLLGMVVFARSEYVETV